MDKPMIFTVGTLNLHIKKMFGRDPELAALWIEGEISNFKQHGSGHMYFSLKDQSSSIKCVMFKSQAERVHFRPESGMAVLLSGYVSVYERDGAYQVYVQEMLPLGAGALQLAYEQLRDQLTKEGLFAEDRKRKLPTLPQKIGIVTSPTGAAVQDMLSIIKRRCPSAEVLLSPAIVQGSEGKSSIVSALLKLYEAGVDVVIVGRGGGSMEDLWNFNEEIVVRTIAASPVPIISAVGHETDYTLSDFAADVRAATPSMAAELVVPVQAALQADMKNRQNRLRQCIAQILQDKQDGLQQYAQRAIFRYPERIWQGYVLRLDGVGNRFVGAMDQLMREKTRAFAAEVLRLEVLSPLQVLARGYGFVQNHADVAIQSVHDLALSEQVEVFLADGSVVATIDEIKVGGWHCEEKDEL